MNWRVSIPVSAPHFQPSVFSCERSVIHFKNRSFSGFVSRLLSLGSHRDSAVNVGHSRHTLSCQNTNARAARTDALFTVRVLYGVRCRACILTVCLHVCAHRSPAQLSGRGKRPANQERRGERPANRRGRDVGAGRACGPHSRVITAAVAQRNTHRSPTRL